MDESGATVFAQEGSCAWMQLCGIARRTQRDGLKTDYEENVFAMSAGAQSEIAEGWFAGGAVGYERFNISNRRADGDGNRVQAGAAVKKALGATLLCGSVSGGIGSTDLRREVITPVGRRFASSDPMIGWVSGHARAAHTFALGDTFSVKPRVDVGGAGPAFTIETDVNQVFADLGTAIEVEVHQRATIEASFDTLLSGNQQEYIGTARVNIAF